MIDVVEINSLVDFIVETNRNNTDSHIYRGHTVDSYQLVPSIARYPHLYKNGSFTWQQFSRELLTTYKNQYELYSNKLLDNDIEYRVVGQHHGLITNLLDWTQNPLVAIYFSVANIKHFEEDESDSVVWALADYESYFPNKIERLPETKKTVVYFPKYFSKRIAAQQGCFTIHNLPAGKDPFLPLEDECGESSLKKYVISGSVKKSIRIELNNIGVNEHSLFPDLVGLCKQLTWKYTNTNYD